MPGLGHDGALAHAGGRRRGGESRAQGVSGVNGGIEANVAGQALDDERHAPVRKPPQDPPMPVDAPEDRALRYSKRLDPGLHRPDRAGLVSRCS